MTPIEQDLTEHAAYEKARVALCELCRHDIEALELIAAMDTYVCDLRDKWYDLDPDGHLYQ